MKDTRSTRDNGSLLSHISEIDFELPGTPKVATPLPPILPDLKTTKKKKKPTRYAPPVSGRESWWRTTIKDTPNPGTYDTHLNTFIKEINGRSMTYGFKSDGRRRDPQPLEPKGKELLPGAYTVEDFAAR